tara:strand:- start:61 stop:582 length:522 start_codon:yes stop_codon:yes gene_type:complete
MQAVETPSEGVPSAAEPPAPLSKGVRRTLGAILLLGVLTSYVALSHPGLTIHGYVEALGYVALVTFSLGVFNGSLTRSYRWAIGTPLVTLSAGLVGSLVGGHLGSWRAQQVFLAVAALTTLAALFATWMSRWRFGAQPAEVNPSALREAELLGPAESSDPEHAGKRPSPREKA